MSTRLVERIAEMKRPLLLAFDVDGTLAPIVSNPAAARVPSRVVSQLRRLDGLRGVRVGLLTGRDETTLRPVLAARQFLRVLEHGRVCVRPGHRAGTGRLSVAQRARMASFRSWARQQAGANVENKATSVVVHTRNLGQRSKAEAQRLLLDAAKEGRRLGLHVRRGRMVLEAQLFESDKGVGLGRLMRSVRARSVVFLGDDLTDLPAIEAAVIAGGMGIFVRSDERPRTPKGCTASLRGTDEVHKLIEELLTALG